MANFVFLEKTKCDHLHFHFEKISRWRKSFKLFGFGYRVFNDFHFGSWSLYYFGHNVLALASGFFGCYRTIWCRFQVKFLTPFKTFLKNFESIQFQNRRCLPKRHHLYAKTWMVSSQSHYTFRKSGKRRFFFKGDFCG